MTLVEQFVAARRVSVPLVAVASLDPGDTQDRLAGTIATNGSKEATGPTLQWDCMSGLEGLNDQGRSVAATLRGAGGSFNSLEQMLEAAPKLPHGTVLFVHNAHLHWRVGEQPNSAVIQGIWNLRDPFKAERRMLVMFHVPGADVPTELAHDVVPLDEQLPAPEQIGEIVLAIHEQAKLPAPKPDVLARAVDALAGLTAFAAEQATAMSLSVEGLNLEALWERKRKMIEQTPGLRIWRGGEKFADIGGCVNIKQYLTRYLAGPERPATIVWIDEIEKQLAGIAGDTSGVSQDQLMKVLVFMADKRVPGILLLGHPGTAKSAFAKAIGNEAGIPTCALDFGAMQHMLVGSSQERVRTALKVIEAVSQGRPLFVATCNSLHVLPTELRRRFKAGTFFFDLPTEDERKTIWPIHLKRFGLSASKNNPIPNDANWTGAEIEACCETAYRLGCPLRAAADYVVTIAEAQYELVQQRRLEASGRFISASVPGKYQYDEAPAVKRPRGSREIEIDGPVVMSRPGQRTDN